jgi:beta-glucosidase
MAVLDVDVRLLGAGDAVLSSERRRAGVLRWDFLDPAVEAIELRTAYRAEAAGEHLIGVSGTGRFRVALGGRPALDETLSLPPETDIAAAHMFPPQAAAPVVLAAGETVAVVVRHEVARDGESTILQLNADVPYGPREEMLAEAEAAARAADVAVVVAGTTDEVESEGFDRDSLALPGAQDELVRRVAAANPRTVVVVNAGSPVLMPWLHEVPAVLLTWFPGQEAGHAIADVLLGRAEPGGRLPTTWPAAEAGLPSTHPVDGVLTYDEGTAIGYRRPGEPLLPFGHGLGYTSWEYLDLEADAATARIRLVNAGTRRGREVVQVYTERPELRLAGFAAVTAEPGEEVVAEVALEPRAFARWQDGGWATEPGAYPLFAGRSVADRRLNAEIARP